MSCFTLLIYKNICHMLVENCFSSISSINSPSERYRFILCQRQGNETVDYSGSEGGLFFWLGFSFTNHAVLEASQTWMHFNCIVLKLHESQLHENVFFSLQYYSPNQSKNCAVLPCWTNKRTGEGRRVVRGVWQFICKVSVLGDLESIGQAEWRDVNLP